jgi:hypothetical protein
MEVSAMEYRFEKGCFLIYFPARSTSTGDIMVVKLLDRPFKDRFEFLVNSKNYEYTSRNEYLTFEPNSNNKSEKPGAFSAVRSEYNRMWATMNSYFEK